MKTDWANSDRVRAAIEQAAEGMLRKDGKIKRLLSREYPISPLDSECLLMWQDIIRAGRRRLFELGTGTGYSTLWLAAAAKVTKGHLTTMDSWIAETTGDRRCQRRSVEPSLGGRARVRRMLCDLGLDRRVDLACGWSPEDVPKFAGEGIDFLFIDGFHAGSAPLRDFKALRPYLASDAVIYWHDTDQRGVASALKVAGEPWKALDTEYHLARMSLNGCPS